jgi:chemotaxis protein histidine kinase CheA
MNRPHGAADFFALEAGECLDRLEQAITHPDGPRADDMLRAARALRGSALMAGQAGIARAAAGFEGLARAVRDRGVAWDAAARERSAQGVDELRHLVRRALEWTDADTTRAARLAADLDALAGSSSGDMLRPVGAPAHGTASTGVRAFVAREGALIASALDRAARALEAAPESREPLYAVLRRMQSLRGLAEIADLPPLPEILDGIELAVGDLTRLFAPPPGVSDVLDAAAAALTRISRDVTEHGRPQGDSPEARAFTAGLLRAFAAEADVVPVESLYRDNDPEPMQRSTAQPQFAPPSALGIVEMVSYGEHLVQSADRIASASQGSARDLRLYTLVSTFRSVAVPGSDPVSPALSRLGRAARAAIGSGSAARDPAGFADVLREAGAVLRSLAEGAPHAEAGRRLETLADRIGGAPVAGIERPRSEHAAETAAAAPVAVAARDESRREPEPAAPQPPRAPEMAPPRFEPEPVAIESLAYDGQSIFAAEVLPIESLVPTDRMGLERGFDRYRALLASGAAAAQVRAAPAATGPEHVPAAATEDDVVDIGLLCYSGRGALERAAQIRAEIARHTRDARDLSGVEPLVRELLDLVPLALAG